MCGWLERLSKCIQVLWGSFKYEHQMSDVRHARRTPCLRCLKSSLVEKMTGRRYEGKQGTRKERRQITRIYATDDNKCYLPSSLQNAVNTWIWDICKGRHKYASETRCRTLEHKKSGVDPRTTRFDHRPLDTNNHSVCLSFLFFNDWWSRCPWVRTPLGRHVLSYYPTQSVYLRNNGLNMSMSLFVFLRLRYMDAKTDLEVDAQASRLFHSSIERCLAWFSNTAWASPSFVHIWKVKQRWGKMKL